MNANIVEILLQNSERFPEKEAIIYQGKKITFRELADRVREIAGFLREKGLKKK